MPLLTTRGSASAYAFRGPAAPPASLTNFQSGDWTGDTSAYTLGDGIVDHSGTNNRAVRAGSITFAGDFTFSMKVTGGGSGTGIDRWTFGVFPSAEVGSFASNEFGGMKSMTNSVHVGMENPGGGAPQFSFFHGGSSEATDSSGLALNDVIKITRAGSTFKIYKNGSLLHTWAYTSSATMIPCIGSGTTGYDCAQVSYVDGAAV